MPQNEMPNDEAAEAQVSDADSETRGEPRDDAADDVRRPTRSGSYFRRGYARRKRSKVRQTVPTIR